MPAIRNIAFAFSFASVVALVPLIPAGSAQALVTGCGTVGPYTTCGTPSAVTNSLINYVKFLTAGIITKDNIIQQQHSAKGYQAALNQLQKNVYRPTANEQTYLNVFTTLAGVFRNAQIDLPYTYAVETTDWYNPTLTNPSTIWAELPIDIANNCLDFMVTLAAA